MDFMIKIMNRTSVKEVKVHIKLKQDSQLKKINSFTLVLNIKIICLNKMNKEKLLKK